MQVLIINNNTSYIDAIKKLLTSHEITVIKFEDFNSSKINNYDLIILSGGHPNSIQYKHQVYEEEIKAVLRSDVPILGICLGFELIVYAFGGKLKELSEKEKGILEIKIINKDPIFKDINELNVFENHRWVSSELPDVIIPLAKSKDGVEIIKHNTRFIYGFQFHPEIVKSKKDLKIFNNFIELVKQKKNSTKDLF